MKPQGVVLLHKKPGQGSFSALSPVKKILSTKKIGHTGTLDQFAQGLLIALVGPMTKLNQQLMNLSKTYKGEIFFGEETDTLDPTGSVVSTGSIPSLRDIEKAIPLFLGETEQSPPKYSALKIQGKRASDLVRQGKEVELKNRKIFIDRFEILSFENQKLEVLITCSKGTYIRSIARDLAYKLGTVAHLHTLVRVAQGPFHLDMAVDPYEFQKENLLSPFDFLSKLPIFQFHILEDQEIPFILNGKNPHIDLPADQENVVLLNKEKQLLAMGQWINQSWKYDFVVGA